MSIISSNPAFTALQLKVAAAKADQQSRVTPTQITTTSGTASENVSQKPIKLFEGLNQQAALHFQVGQALRAKAAASHSKEPQLNQIKSVIIAPVALKKDPKESASASVGRHDEKEKATGLFDGLRLEAKHQDDGSVDPDAQ